MNIVFLIIGLIGLIMGSLALYILRYILAYLNVVTKNQVKISEILKEGDKIKYCPGCGMEWEKDCDAFGCWSCGYEKQQNKTD